MFDLHRQVGVECFFLVIFPSSEFYLFAFRFTMSVPSL
jgi:hypothetical protein